MKRMGVIVRRLYAEELKSATNGHNGSAKGKRSRATGKLSALKKTLFKKRSVVWALRIVAVLFVLFVVAETIFQFNRLASWNTIVLARKADVDREFKRRDNLLPNLILAVSEYASYELGVVTYVANSHELKRPRSGEAAKTKMSDLLGRLSPSMLALAEQYPDLKTSGPFQTLMTEVSDTENRVAEAKKDYNKAAEVYNQYISIVPGKVFAYIFDFGPAKYMGLDEESATPVIDLKITDNNAAEG